MEFYLILYHPSSSVTTGLVSTVVTSATTTTTVATEATRRTATPQREQANVAVGRGTEQRLSMAAVVVVVVLGGLVGAVINSCALVDSVFPGNFYIIYLSLSLTFMCVNRAA